VENKQINELEKLELEKNKLLLSAENVIGFTSTITFLSSVLGAAFVECSDLVKAVFIVSGTSIFVTGISFALKIEQKVGYYKCSKCEHTYVPKKYSKVFFASHMGKTRYMGCPECGEKSWQKKVLIKKQK
jgi:DNA-directed RNA polymerase subunit RPC12/RpoP